MASHYGLSPAVASHDNEKAIAKGHAEPGAQSFLATLDGAPPAEQDKLRRMANWAVELEKEGLCELKTYHGLNNLVTLLPLLRPDNVGLVTIYHDKAAYLAFYRSVFERRAPVALAAIESDFPSLRIGKGTTCRDVSEALFSALTQAYREANGASPK